MLQHRMPEDQLFALLGAKEKIKKPKELQLPREIAERHAYKNCDHYLLPLEYVRGTFIRASSDYKTSHSSRKSLKSVAGGAFRPLGEFTSLLDKNGQRIVSFEVDIRKATNHLKGAVAVCRPRFDYWRADFLIELNTDVISQDTALRILQDAGRRVGVGSYRVEKGGYFGQFQVIKWAAQPASQA